MHDPIQTTIPGEKLRLTSILSRSLDVFGSSLGHIALTLLCFVFPAHLLLNVAFILMPATPVVADASTINTINWSVLGPILGLSALIYLLIDVSLLLFSQVMLILLAEKKRLKQQVTFGGLIREAMAAFRTAFPTYLLLILGLLLGFLLLVLPGIYLSVIWGFALIISVLLGVGGRSALAASAKLVKGRWWKTFGYFLVFLLIALILERSLAYPERLLTNPNASLGLTNILTTVGTMEGIMFLVLYSLANTLSYFGFAFTTVNEVIFFRALEVTKAGE